MTDCDQPVKGHELCNRHYQRWRKYGTAEPQPHVFASLADRFWAKVRKGEPDECWLWTAGQTKDGYGQFRPGGTAPCMSASRMSWHLAHPGVTLPPEINVCHRCDNRLCVNPAHLFDDTVAANIADRDAKGRQATGMKVTANRRAAVGERNGRSTHPESTARGEGHGNARWTADDIRAIRAAYANGESQGSIARRLGTAQAAISQIVLRKAWAHVD